MVSREHTFRKHAARRQLLVVVQAESEGVMPAIRMIEDGDNHVGHATTV